MNTHEEAECCKVEQESMLSEELSKLHSALCGLRELSTRLNSKLSVAMSPKSPPSPSGSDAAKLATRAEGSSDLSCQVRDYKQHALTTAYELEDILQRLEV